MEKKITSFIQNHFYKITNTTISKKDIKNFILPIFYNIFNNKLNKILISGSQGIGKTSYLKLIEIVGKKIYNKKILSLSLDDFYLDKKERKKIAKNIHPLLITRGVPGTHDVPNLIKIIKKFDESKYPIKLNIFDKLSDSRIKKKKIIKTKCDILILEGWCLGCPPINNNFLMLNINILEKKFDKDCKWRQYYNNQLKNSYSKIFKQFNYIIYLKASSFSHVLKWRIKQEKYLRKKNKLRKSIGMTQKDISIFLQYYEKITKWMLKTMPVRSNIVLYISSNQRISKIIKN